MWQGKTGSLLPPRELIAVAVVVAVVVELCPPAVGAVEIGAIEQGAAQIGALEVGVAQIGAAQIGAAQIGLPQIGLLQVGLPQIGAAQIGLPQIGLPQIGLPQIGAAQIGAREVGIAQIGAVEVHAIEAILFVEAGHRVREGFGVGRDVRLAGVREGERVGGHGGSPIGEEGGGIAAVDGLSFSGRQRARQDFFRFFFRPARWTGRGGAYLKERARG